MIHLIGMTGLERFNKSKYMRCYNLYIISCNDDGVLDNRYMFNLEPINFNAGYEEVKRCAGISWGKLLNEIRKDLCKSRSISDDLYVFINEEESSFFKYISTVHPKGFGDIKCFALSNTKYADSIELKGDSAGEKCNAIYKIIADNSIDDFINALYSESCSNDDIPGPCDKLDNGHVEFGGTVEDVHEDIKNINKNLGSLTAKTDGKTRNLAMIIRQLNGISNRAGVVFVAGGPGEINVFGLSGKYKIDIDNVPVRLYKVGNREEMIGSNYYSPIDTLADIIKYENGAIEEIVDYSNNLGGWTW